MNAEVKEKWLAALRSGEYKPAVAFMRHSDTTGANPYQHRFCCLGVLCDLYAKEHGMKFMDLFPGADLRQSKLPGVVEQWAGLNFRQCQPLADLNDRMGTYPIAAIEALR